uniref:cellulose 1,4-beta-cellobiosidase (non-reducing end) n=1 Tax=Mesosa myops TaxID=993118 RepID=A0A6F7XSQ0_9CUCU|nr:beta-1,4-exoglucanase [Mesosa myops]
MSRLWLVGFCFFALAALACGQQAGTMQAETHPKLTWKQCSGAGSCTAQNGEIVLDSNWRWLRKDDGGYSNCYTGNTWDAEACPDDASCAKNCALEGADYSGTYGITSSGDSLTLKLVTGSNVGSRTYLMKDEETYQVFNLLNKEFTFDVDVSKLPCGTNGALYFVEMPADGDKGKGNNNAGAKYGTGYCDAQCPHDLKFIAGEANVEGWEPSEGDKNSGSGKYGSCCNEMDIWEANSMGAAYTPHTCKKEGLYRCTGTECGDGDERYSGVCDKDGCDYSHYRLGATDYFGPGKTVDTNSKMTVVTQFVGNPLTEIRRFYIQNGKQIDNSVVSVPGVSNYSSITGNFCEEYKQVFGDQNSFDADGGLSEMSASLGRGHVLVMSLWVDFAAHMLWLDSSYPTDGDPSKPGIKRGECATSSGVPADVISQNADAQVVFSNIRFGDIGSTTST